LTRKENDMRGRKPLPDEVKRLKGTWEKPRNPPAAPVVLTGPLDPITAEPPDCLSDLAKGCWRELVTLAVPGILRQSDAIMLEVCARLLAEMRSPDPLGGMMGHARLRLLMGGLSSLGMDPAARARLGIQAPTPRVSSVWDELDRVLEPQRPMAALLAMRAERGND
jgi:hypothetical protein